MISTIELIAQKQVPVLPEQKIYLLVHSDILNFLLNSNDGKEKA